MIAFVFILRKKQDGAIAEMAWIIANPDYMRSAMPYYSFNILSHPEYSEKPVATSESITTSILNVITPAVLGNYLLSMYSHFLNVHGKRFAKPYTPTQLIKVTTHTVDAEELMPTADEYEWTLIPMHLDVKNGAFCLFWKAHARPIKIELGIEDDVEECADKSPASEIMELSPDALPPVEAEGSLLRLTSNTQLRDKKIVHEARIRAKWAQYKAEKAIAKYLQRYGELDEELLSDSSTDDEDISENE